MTQMRIALSVTPSHPLSSAFPNEDQSLSSCLKALTCWTRPSANASESPVNGWICILDFSKTYVYTSKTFILMPSRSTRSFPWSLCYSPK
ncbi:hypothetical protein K439DRAFT_239299 [Ramaria rubella]|nr:hypothetical protein K439DRAFT_239299 [Ramaria rubella]